MGASEGIQGDIEQNKEEHIGCFHSMGFCGLCACLEGIVPSIFVYTIKLLWEHSSVLLLLSAFGSPVVSSFNGMEEQS